MDESQSFGVLGATGRGVTEHFDVDVSIVVYITRDAHCSYCTYV